jgi:antitoxin component YwqK of YwqJK toxin-antitoxin module
VFCKRTRCHFIYTILELLFLKFRLLIITISKYLVVVLLSSFVFWTNSYYSQEHKISDGDTTYMKLVGVSYKLKEHLGDGTWLVYQVIDKKPWKKNRDLYSNPKYRGQLIEIAEYRDGSRNGKTIIYQPQPYNHHEISSWKIESGYVDGLLNGDFIIWYKDSTKEREGSYVRGKQNGDWYSWYPNQKMEAKYHYDLGVLSKWTQWYTNEKKKAEGYGDYCHRGDTLTSWYSNGNRLGEWLFNKGNLETWTEYYENGNLKAKGKGGFLAEDVKNSYSFGKCIDGKPYKSPKEGKWSYWNMNGKLIKEETYKNDLRIELKKGEAYTKSEEDNITLEVK